MAKVRSTRSPSLLFALELLDAMVRQTSIGPSYLDSTTQQAVADVIGRAKKRLRPKAIKPREDQLQLPGTVQ